MKPDKFVLSLTLLIFLTIFSWFTSCTHIANIANLPEVCFTGQVLPIFINNCAMAGCHDGGGREERRPLNTYADIMRDITPGNPDGSRVYQTIIAKWENHMPPGQPLSLENRTIIRVWIEQGAALTTCTDTTGQGGGGNTYVARACFTRDILPVIISRCASTGCATIASSGALINSLKGYGVPQLPLGTTFSACRIRQFEMWINNGFPNN